MTGRLFQISDAGEFESAFNVSRETLEKLEIYADRLRQWQRAVNLVSPSTLPDIWQRHFADSAQLIGAMPEKFGHLVDVGSGGGFPGLVVSILLSDTDRVGKTTLIESDQRKCAFLREVARAVDNPVQILSTRIETSATVHATGPVDILSARALAPLGRLLAWVAPYCGPTTQCVFLKGRNASEEIEAARMNWAFDVQITPSRTDPDGHVLVISNLHPVSE